MADPDDAPTRRTPPTDEGWYVLHDMRRIAWDDWRRLSEDTRAAVLDEAVDLWADLLEPETGDSGLFVGLGHEVDLLGIHLRPTLGELDAIERRIDRSPLGEFTHRTDSYVSVTEVSGYLMDDYFDEAADVDPGTERYVASRLYPSVPDAGFVSFYPMSKRRGESVNWYDLPFEDRARHVAAHGDIGKGYAGQVTQIISGSIGFEPWEWGITLFADDPTAVKALLYEMRFDPSTSRFGEFGAFTVGRHIDPDDLPALFAGEAVGEASTGDDGGAPAADEADSVRDALEDAGVYAGQPHGEDVHALVVYSDADRAALDDRVDRLVSNFDHYDTHVDTGVYAADGRLAVVSIWETASAAETAGGFLGDLPDVIERAGEGEGWETMGMFYRVEPEHREAFRETFGEVAEGLADRDGHRETHLFTRIDDDCDMFISSRWDAREDAMAFFGDDAFRETVEWGRDVLQERPRHVFLE